MKPSVGRIVHFIQSIDEPIAAIITRVHTDEMVNLTVFPDQLSPTIEPAVMLRRSSDEVGVWDWPPRVEE